MFYDFATAGFYSPIVHSSIPAGAVEIADSEYALLIRGLSAGQHIGADADGLPILIDPPPPAPDTLEQVLAKRQAAYVAESDPLKNEAEYDAIIAGTEPDYTAWLAKVAEIKARLPLP